MGYLQSQNSLKAYRPKAKILKLLGNERRLAMLDFLAANETTKVGLTVSDLAEKLKIPYKAASQHLQLMDTKGLVDRLRVGKEVQYMTSDVGKGYLEFIHRL